MKQDLIARDLKEFQSQLEYACRRFQVSPISFVIKAGKTYPHWKMNSLIEISRATELFEQSRARDMDHLTTILEGIASSHDDLKSLMRMKPIDVETVMRSLQKVRT